jgi:hypothetical protein
MINERLVVEFILSSVSSPFPGEAGRAEIIKSIYGG